MRRRPLRFSISIGFPQPLNAKDAKDAKEKLDSNTIVIQERLFAVRPRPAFNAV
jgi:hypothetical protein